MDPSDPIEDLRLEVERYRLEIERAGYLNESERTFLQRWRTEVVPIHESRERSRELASSFAQAGIKSMFLLNGGALIALPAFAELVDVTLSQQIGLFLVSIFSFVAGLLFIAITTLLAYMSLDADVSSLHQSEEVVRLDLIKGRITDSFTKEQENQRTGADKEREKKSRIAQTLTRWAVGLAVGSTVAFVIGAGVAGIVLSS